MLLTPATVTVTVTTTTKRRKTSTLRNSSILQGPSSMESSSRSTPSCQPSWQSSARLKEENAGTRSETSSTICLYRILKLWRCPEILCLCGLYHSSYSNATTDLAVFGPDIGRGFIRAHLGGPAERLVYLFFSIARMDLVRDYILHSYADDQELLDHLKASESSLRISKESGGVFNHQEPWRKKVNSILPPEGITIKHKITGEDLGLSRRFVAAYLMMVVADFSEQMFDFQDRLFENYDGTLDFKGNNTVGALWPGNLKPGLWMHFISRTAAVYLLVVREEEIFMEEKKMRFSGEVEIDRKTRISSW
ncbi:hypothetical protein SAY87_006107 [Trapa incisa]|uniref:DUF6817 domain-containing protein n=1 Tax=Trapa incisa TaxID=236973 RepID=A0AAN7K765_9MYRT|nr:hypothetical protein SAY87_006107 [Trapa incisa]